MELTYDWKNFQSMFYLKKRLSQISDAPLSPVYLVVERSVIVSIFAEGEDLSDWMGATYDELHAELAHRELILFDRKQVDEWMVSATELTHFYDQIEFLKEQATPSLVSKGRLKGHDILGQNHFLLAAIQSWWHKLLPSTYGIYIRLDNNPNTAIFITIQRGRVDSFQIPDLSSMVTERKRVAGDIVKHLSERYLMPVQGMFLTSAEWSEWSESPNPWRKIASAIKSNRYKLAPFSWGITTLVALRAYFGM